MSLDSPPPPPPPPLHGPSQLDLLSRGGVNGDVSKEAAAAAAAAAAAVHAEYAAAFAAQQQQQQQQQQQRVTGPHLGGGAGQRNGSITPPFEENGVASPIEQAAAHKGASSPSSASSSSSSSGQNGQSGLAGLSTSMDSAPPVMQHAAGYPKNRFFSGDHANSRETLMRRQIYSIGKDGEKNHIFRSAVHLKGLQRIIYGIDILSSSAESDHTLSPVEKSRRKASLIMELNSAAAAAAAAAAVRLQQQQQQQQQQQSTTPPTNGMNASSSLFPAFNTDAIDSMGE